MRFQEAAWGEPHVAWELILAILDADNSMKVVANLAAGPSRNCWRRTPISA